MELTPHLCVGALCPFVVDTGEDLVCSLTGVCCGAVFADSFDHAASRSTIHLTAKESGVVSTTPKRENNSEGDAFGECFRVVTKLLFKKKETFEVGSGVLKIATKLARSAVVRKKGRIHMFPAFVQFARGLLSVDSGCEESAFLHRVAQRCSKCCSFAIAMLPKSASAKTNIEYICLATLYIMREGVIVKGSVLCEIDEEVASRLPSLNTLNTLGYKKSKYTKAERFLRKAIEEAMFTKPLHEIKI